MNDHDDRLFEILASLPTVTPDAGRESLVRARCHSVMARRAIRHVRTRRDSRAGLFDLAGAAALCIYLAAMLSEAVRLIS